MSSRLADWATVIGTAIAVLGLVVALGLGTASTQILLLGLARARRIGRTLGQIDRALGQIDAGRFVKRGVGGRALAHIRFWRRFERRTRTLIGERVRFGDPHVVDEFAWVSQVLCLLGNEPAGAGVRVVPVPLTFVVARDQRVDLERWRRQALEQLARAFDGYAATIRRRWLLRAATGPLANDEYACARRTSARLAALAHHTAVPVQSDPPWIALRPSPRFGPGGAAATRLLAWPAPRSGRGDIAFSTLNTSYTPYRVVRPGSPGERTAGERQTLVVPWGHQHPPEGGHFDGIMSRLHGHPGYRVELDEHSGRQSLHLSLSETSFFAFSGTQWAEHEPELLGENAFSARALSVNLVLVDDRGSAILVERSRAISHPEGFAGAVSGACELVDREGIRADIDGEGFPDPMRTLVREAREELGLDLSGAESRLSALGLIQVRSPRDLGTHVLVATARLPTPAGDFRVRVGSTDDVEGTWELGGRSMVVDLPSVEQSKTRLSAFVRWLRTSDELLPHGAGSLLLLLATQLQRPTAQQPSAPTFDDLVTMLGEPLPTRPAARPRAVRFQDLWAHV